MHHQLHKGCQHQVHQLLEVLESKKSIGEILKRTSPEFILAQQWYMDLYFWDSLIRDSLEAGTWLGGRILVLTGAGISVSCGIPDFRSEKGVYAMVEELGLQLPAAGLRQGYGYIQRILFMCIIFLNLNPISHQLEDHCKC